MKNIVYLEEKEIGELFETLDQVIEREKNKNEKKRLIRNKAILAVMYYCALRVSETTILKMEDYDSKKHELYCHRIKNGISHEYKFYDGFKWVEKALRKHISVNKPEKYLFTSSRNSEIPISRKTIDVMYRNIMSEMKKKGIKVDESKNSNCNILRSSMAMHLKGRGAGIFEVQYWLGHVKIENTAIYFPEYNAGRTMKNSDERTFSEMLKGEGAYKKKEKIEK